MKKLFLLLLFLLLIFSFSCKKQSTEKVKVGFIGPLTGDYANYGKLMSQAVRIAIEEKNKKGGIDGMMIELIAEDSEGQPEKANAAIEKLASVDGIWGLIGCVFSSCSLAVAPKAELEKIVMISPSSTHKDLPGKGDFILRTVITDELQAKVFAKYVNEVMGLKQVAILYTKNDYSQGLANDFKAQFEQDGGSITAMETGLQGDKDFKTQLTKIKATNPEAVFLPNYVAEIAQALEQANQLGITAQMLSADGFTNPEILDIAGDFVDGVIFSGPESGMKLTAQFEKKYEEKWGEKPDNFSLNAYDGAAILIGAIEKAYKDLDKEDKTNLNINRDSIQKYVIETKNFPGASGEITFAKNGDVLKNIAVSTVENKQYKQLNVYKLDEQGNLVKVK